MAKGDGFAVCTMKKQSGGGGGLSAHIDREVYDAELDRMIPFRPASVRDDSRRQSGTDCKRLVFQGKKMIKKRVRERLES